MQFREIVMAAAQGGGKPFFPTDLGGSLFGYFDSENASSLILSGSNVSQWTDPITGAAPVQATGANQPTYSATGLNGRPVVNGNGTSSRLQTSGNTPFPIGGNSIEIWALVNQAALPADTGSRYFFLQGTANVSGLGRVVNAGVNQAQLPRGGGGAAVNAADFSGIHVLRGIENATSTRLDVDGVAGTATGNSTTTGAGPLVLFSLAGGSLFWNGGVNSIWITAALNASQAAQMLGFLKNRGGLA